MHLGETEQFVVGLVTSQVLAPLYGNEKVQLAEVIPSTVHS